MDIRTFVYLQTVPTVEAFAVVFFRFEGSWTLISFSTVNSSIEFTTLKIDNFAGYEHPYKRYFALFQTICCDCTYDRDLVYYTHSSVLCH